MSTKNPRSNRPGGSGLRVRFNTFLRGWLLPGTPVVLLALAMSGAFRARSGYLRPGTQITSVKVLDIAGSRSVELKDLAKEGPLALHLFGTWCPACMREWPSLPSYATRYGEDIRLVPIGIDDPRQIQALLQEEPVPVRVYAGGKTVEGALQVPSYPFTIFVDADLRVVHDHAGALDDSAYRTALGRIRRAASGKQPTQPR